MSIAISLRDLLIEIGFRYQRLGRMPVSVCYTILQNGFTERSGIQTLFRTLAYDVLLLIGIPVRDRMVFLLLLDAFTCYTRGQCSVHHMINCAVTRF